MRPSRYLTILALLTATGCASLPTGPSVRVLPSPGKPFEQFMKEDEICRRWAEQTVGMKPGETSNRTMATSATLGTLIGAGAGAALGAAAGNAGVGAAIGGGTGLLFGSASGSEAAQASGADVQRRYDNTYVQCMYASGNQVPGVRMRRSSSAPPDYDSVPPDYYPPR